MSGECAFGCRHPLWGGDGECITADDPNVDDSCVCDAGYASRDSFGNPSCVPFNALDGLFTIVALVGTAAILLLLWHLAHHVRSPESARRARKAVIRLRLIVSASVSISGIAFVFWSAVARRGAAPLLEGGMFYAMFGLTYPMGVFAALQVAELWLNHLPAPLVKRGSKLEKLKTAATKRNLFFWGGFVSSGNVLLLSALSLVFGQREMRRILHLIMAASTALAGIGFVAVAVFLTRAINGASAKSPQAWHSRAKRNIRVEAGSLVVMSAVYTSAAVVLEGTYEGSCTPLIPFSVMVTASTVAQAAVVHTSRPARGGAAAASPRSEIISPRSSAVLGKLGARSKKATGDENSGALERGVLSPVRTPAALPNTCRNSAGLSSKNKIIPTISDPVVAIVAPEKNTMPDPIVAVVPDSVSLCSNSNV